MYSYRIVIRTDDLKSEKKGTMIDINEYYVSKKIEKVIDEALKQTEIHQGELIAIIRQDPIRILKDKKNKEYTHEKLYDFVDILKQKVIKLQKENEELKSKDK